MFPNELFNMNYSQLIDDPEFEIRKMLKFC